MLRVLRHYLPIRKALLIVSETVLLTLVLTAGLTAHLWWASSRVLYLLAHEIPSLSRDSAQIKCAISAVLFAILAQVAIAFNELYDVRISSSRYDRAARFVESAGSALALALLGLLIGSSARFGRVLDLPGLALTQSIQVLVFSMLLGFGVLYAWRHFFHYLLRRVSFNERVLILGSGKSANELALEIKDRPDSGFEVVSWVEEDLPAARRAGAEAKLGTSASTVAAASMISGLQTIKLSALTSSSTEGSSRVSNGNGGGNGNGNGHSSDSTSLYDMVKKTEVDLVVVALEDRRRQLPTEDLLRCRLEGIPVTEQEALYERITGKIAIEAMRPSYLIFNEGFSRHGVTELFKRLVDIVCATIGILLTWPLMLMTAIAIRFDSEGLTLFSQERVGRDGKPFTLHKFRSMRSDAEKLTGPVWAQEDDPRITRVGRFIRRTRLDELPQLFNVLGGSMSMVGPRPERPHFVSELSQQIPYFNQRHIVKPGITGWAQINYPYGNTVEDALRKLQYDLFYIKNQSVLFDLSILFNTVKTVILRKGT